MSLSEQFFFKYKNQSIMSSPFTSLNKYRKLPLSKTPMIASNETSGDEKYNKIFSLWMTDN